MLDPKTGGERRRHGRNPTMTHWHTQDSLAREHRQDLDREALRATLVAEAKAMSNGSEATTPATSARKRAPGWIRAHAARLASAAALRARLVR
jgi:hypothetical protein